MHTMVMERTARSVSKSAGFSRFDVVECLLGRPHAYVDGYRFGIALTFLTQAILKQTIQIDDSISRLIFSSDPLAFVGAAMGRLPALRAASYDPVCSRRRIGRAVQAARLIFWLFP